MWDFWPPLTGTADQVSFISLQVANSLSTVTKKRFTSLMGAFWVSQPPISEQLSSSGRVTAIRFKSPTDNSSANPLLSFRTSNLFTQSLRLLSSRRSAKSLSRLSMAFWDSTLFVSFAALRSSIAADRTFMAARDSLIEAISVEFLIFSASVILH